MKQTHRGAVMVAVALVGSAGVLLATGAPWPLWAAWAAAVALAAGLSASRARRRGE
jgi:hypothetical protein